MVNVSGKSPVEGIHLGPLDLAAISHRYLEWRRIMNVAVKKGDCQ